VFGKLNKKKCGQAAKHVTQRQRWHLENFQFLGAHVIVRTNTRQLAMPPPDPPQQHEEEEDEEEEEALQPDTQPTAMK
jgi:hypothetical protein